MTDVIGKALVLVLIMALGYAIKRLGWVAASDFGVISRIVLRVTLPCALATNFNTFHLTPTLLAVAGFGAVIDVVGMVVIWFALVSRGRRGRAFGIINVPNYNIGLFAMPYAAALVGPEAIPLCALFDVGNALVSAGLGYGWGVTLARPGARVTVIGLLRQVFRSPVFDTYLVLLLLRLADITLPAPVIAFTSTVGQANTFLAMLMIGIGLEIVLPKSKYAAALGYMALRYALVACNLVALWFVMPFDHGTKVIVSMALTAPMAAMVSGFTAEAGLDVDVSAFMTSASTLIAIVATPLAYVLLR